MLPHGVEQGDEARARLRRFGMVLPKCLLANGQGTLIPGSRFLAVALRFPKQRKIMHGLRRFRMLRSQRLFADV